LDGFPQIFYLAPMNADIEVLPKASLSLPDMGQLVSAFLDGRSEHTRRMYTQDLEDFKTFIKKDSLTTTASYFLKLPQGEANLLAMNYQTSLKKRELAPATINHRLAALSSLVRLGRMLGFCTFTLTLQRLPVQAYRNTKGPGADGVEAILSKLEPAKTEVEKRDYAMLRLMYDLALRRSEVTRLDMKNVNLDKGKLEILGKGRTQTQHLTIPDETRLALRAWINERGFHEGALFTNLSPARTSDNRISTTGLYKMVQKRGKEAGVSTRPHGLRHAAITQALDLMQGDVRSVMRYSRHQDMKTVSIYDDNRKDLAGDVAKLVAQGKPKTR
jgi:integrase/recombinase XerC